jgi:formylglycine-generating enzyme required for sulfatase activity
LVAEKLTLEKNKPLPMVAEPREGVDGLSGQEYREIFPSTKGCEVMKRALLQSAWLLCPTALLGLVLLVAPGCNDGKKPAGKTPVKTSETDAPVKVQVPGDEASTEKPLPPLPRVDDEPQTPAAPATEEKPASPAVEEKPDMPAAPVTEEKPDAPAVEEKPDTPAAPAMEEKPDAPTVPATEEKPDAPAAPTTEEKPDTLAAPAMEEKPDAPAVEEKPDAPAVPAMEEQPATEEKPTAPAAEEKPAAPAVEEKPAAPAIEEKPAATEAQPVALAIPEKHKYSLEPVPAWLTKATEVADATAAQEGEMKPYTEVISGSDVKFDLVPIKGGKFLMGSPESEAGRKPCEGPQCEVEIEPFWMGKHEITWGEYELWCLKLDIQRRKHANLEPTENDKIADAVSMPTNPYTDMSFGMGKDGYPAVCMTQLAAKMYCKWLSAKTGRYYRLPTEAEWEYACRAGTTTAYSFGDDPDQLDDYAWYLDNSDDKYQKIGKKKPNPWGLHDMHGNVAEWVLDQYVVDSYKTFAGMKSPITSATTEYNRVIRGGSWDDEAPGLRSAARRGSVKSWKDQDPQIPQSTWYLTDAAFVGFRVVRPLKTPTPEEAKRYEIDDSQVTEFLDYDEAQAGKM